MAQGNPVTPILRHADGTAVTAQEAYDAFMNTRVLIVKGGTTFEAISMVWYDNNSTQNDPANAGYVDLRYVATVSGVVVIEGGEAGDPSLIPTQQG